MISQEVGITVWLFSGDAEVERDAGIGPRTPGW